MLLFTCNENIVIIIACCNCTKQLELETMSLESASINSDTSFGNESVLEISSVSNVNLDSQCALLSDESKERVEALRRRREPVNVL